MSDKLSVIEDDDGRIPGGMLAAAPTVSTAIQMAAALVDKRIATARSYPRSISRFKKEAGDLLSVDVETARSAEYAKPVGGGRVTGPSIRLAELAAMCWGNLDVTVDEPIVSDKSVSVKATAWDLERNYRQEAVVTTSILLKNGGRFPAHMVETASLATAAKAKRNAILAVIPRAYVNDLLEKARAVAQENEEPLEQVRAKMLAAFARTYKVTAEQVCGALSVAGPDDIGTAQVEELRHIWTALSEGAAVEDFFGVKPESKAAEVKAKIDGRKAAAAPLSPPAAAVTPPPPAASPPPAKPTGKPLVLDLLDQLAEAGGGDGAVATFLGKHNLTVEDIQHARGANSTKYANLIRDEIAKCKGAS